MKTVEAGLERAARSMLRTLGAGKASLLVSQPSTASPQTGLGTNSPMVAEVELEPVLLRSATNGLKLYAVMTRGTAEKALNGMAGRAAAEVLEGAMLRAAGAQYRIVAVIVKCFGGSQLLYALEIEE